MDESEKKAVLELYPEFHTVYGPYVRKDQRTIVVLYDGEKRSARQLAKVRLEVKLGRRLVGDETVDHENNDFTDDSENNLRILPLVDNASQGALKIVTESIMAVCIHCKNQFKLSRHQHSQRALNCAGPFCSRGCATQYRHAAKLENESDMPRSVEKKYYK